MNDFSQEWAPTEKDLLRRELAENYVHTTEAYDRTVCTGPVIDGLIYPATPSEQGLIARNAREALDKAYRVAAAHGISREELKKEIARCE